ncbi:hypothetical protein [Streptomyces sp. NPDC096311]|uniref:hypothetical protein n=1 Tax=Streptomyces sp. NPDC096311 TaxID=3366083 RepID=UPI0038058EC7
MAGLPQSVRPLTAAVVAVDAAHEGHDPVHHVGAWRRQRLDLWRTGGRMRHSPLLRAALTCIVR